MAQPKIGEAIQPQVGHALGAGANKPIPIAKQPHSLAEMEKAARDFEGLLLEQMMKTMSQTVQKDALFDSKEQEYFQDFFNQEVSKTISAGKGIGVRSVILKEFQHLEVGDANSGLEASKVKAEVSNPEFRYQEKIGNIVGKGVPSK